MNTLLGIENGQNPEINIERHINGETWNFCWNLGAAIHIYKNGIWYDSKFSNYIYTRQAAKELIEREIIPQMEWSGIYAI